MFVLIEVELVVGPNNMSDPETPVFHCRNRASDFECDWRKTSFRVKCRKNGNRKKRSCLTNIIVSRLAKLL
jgi:hypothetical protein